MGIDWGRRRAGVALSDPLGITARPLTVIEYPSADALLDDLATLASEHDVTQVVVGLPVRLDGTEGPAADAVRNFAGKLHERLRVPVDFWDERLSTAQAERAMLDADLSRARRKKRRDKVAAQIVLQSYLDAHRTPRS